jgi:hypothetical protein
MNVLHARRWIIGIARAMAAVYLMLVFAAAGCIFFHAAAPMNHDHHDSDTTHHASLCTWLCQATADTGLVHQEPSGASASIRDHHRIDVQTPPGSYLLTSLHPRAPPFSSF